ncbi:alpha/beta hydrolase [Candidatus Uhrbacteria bacterium]|nr:alpha/beta hydrolase [Candidatus Uhrbacteria bacterium]
MRIVLVHGYKSSPQQNFWPWLRDELAKRGHDTIPVTLPNPETPNCQEWVEAINQAISRPGGDTIFIGHSLGNIALLHYLENAQMSGTPKSVIMISAPYFIGHARFESFFTPPVDFDTVMWKGQEFAIIHAKDDTIVPFDHALKYERELNGHLFAPETGGHFLEVKELPLVLELIQERSGEPGSTLHDDFHDIHLT